MSVRRWAESLLLAQPAAAIQHLAADPVSVLSTDFGIECTPAAAFDQRGDGGLCDGMSIIDNNIILYRPTGSRRQSFTLCHEFGHYLIDRDDDCLDWCLDQPQPARTIESLADAIAGLILVPESTRSGLGAAPQAAQLFDLFDDTNASRSACLNVLVDRISNEGFGVLIDAAQPDVVFYASRKGETRPYPWKQDPIPTSHRLRQVDGYMRGRSSWPYPDGSNRSFYIDIATDGAWTVALFSDNNIWGVAGGSFVQLDDRARHDGNVRCPNKACNYEGRTSNFPCNECGQSPCPKCHECRCDFDERTIARSMCQACTVTVRVELLDNDRLCPACR